MKLTEYRLKKRLARIEAVKAARAERREKRRLKKLNRRKLTQKEKKIITIFSTLIGVGLALIAVAVVLIVLDAAIFTELNGYAADVAEGTMTVEKFNEVYAPLNLKSNLYTIVSLVLLLGGVVSIVLSIIKIKKTLGKKED